MYLLFVSRLHRLVFLFSLSSHLASESRAGTDAVSSLVCVSVEKVNTGSVDVDTSPVSLQ